MALTARTNSPNSLNFTANFPYLTAIICVYSVKTQCLYLERK
jgi:hypothetical protein